MKPETFDFMDLGGGQNDGLAATHIKDNEFAELVNFFTYGQKIVRRDGIARLTTVGSGQEATTVFAFRNSDSGEWVLFAGLSAGLGRKDGGSVVALSVGDGQIYSSSTNPWCMGAYKNIGYAIRPATGRLKRFTRDVMFDAGIVAPSGAPTVADGGAGGSIAAGTYRAVVTFYNSDTGAESNPSPVSGSVTIAASHKITWTGIPTAVPTLQVNARRLYRTLADQQGQYFFVGQLNDNVTTTFTDDVTTANMGDAASFENGIPPSGTGLLAFWKERAWVATEKEVTFSRAGLPESFGATSLIQVFPDDGHVITAIGPWGDRFVIGKTNMVTYLVGTDASDFALQVLSERHGIWSHFSMKSIEGQLLWYGGDNIYRSGGDAPVAISTYKVRQVLDAIPQAQRGEVYAAVHAQRSWYLLSIPQASGRKILCYNYRTDSWSVFETPDAVAFFTESFDEDGAGVLYGCNSGDQQLYQLDSGTNDYGTVITARAKTKAHGLGQQDVLRFLQRLKIMAPQVAANATIRIYRDNQASVVKQRVVSLDLPARWKNYSLDHRGYPGTNLQIEIEYAAAPAWEVQGLSLDVVSTTRTRNAA